MPNSPEIDVLSKQELQSLILQLQDLTDKYKRSEHTQKALFRISEMASSASDLNELYASIHDIISELVTADNFYVAFHHPDEKRIEFAYFVDQQDEDLVPEVPYERLMEGLTGHILKTGETLVLTQENIEQIKRDKQINILGTAPVDLIGAPLVRGDEVIGAMIVQSYSEHIRYSQEDREIILFISQHIVNVVDRVKNRELIEATIKRRTQQLRKINQELQEEIQERQRAERLHKVLFEISELSTTDIQDMAEFYRQIHKAIQRLLPAPNCYVALLSECQSVLEFPYFADNSKVEALATRPFANGLTEYVIRQGKARLINSAQAEKLGELNELSSDVVDSFVAINNSWLGAPLVIKAQVKGVIAIQTYGKQSQYSASDLELLQFVSRHIAVAIERKQNTQALLSYNQQLAAEVESRTQELNDTNKNLQQQIEHRKLIEQQLLHDAQHDGLTDLPNRAVFERRLELALAAKKRSPEKQFAVLFIDLDRFKLVNDSMGHQAGDQLLIKLSHRFNKCKRGSDLLARFGGDEFVLLLDDINGADHAIDVATRIIDEAQRAIVIQDQHLHSGASVGIAMVQAWHHESDQIIRDADAAMYHAKSAGRNTFAVFTASMREQLLSDLTKLG